MTGLALPLPAVKVSDETPESLIPYDEIVQDALRAVVGRVLREVEQTGTLPGDHHFYITFHTDRPSVGIADWLRQHRRSRFLLTAPPLRLPGAVGSPVTPVATV